MANNLVFQEIFDGGSTGGSSTGGGSTGGGGGIIEVLQLPTENIDNRYLYRVTKASLWFNNVKEGNTYVVDELPATGEPVTTDGATVNTTYYNDTDNTLYGYVPAMIGSVLGVPEGWYTAEMLIPALGFSYGGVITNLVDASERNTFYLLLTNPLYSYEDGNWYEVATTGASLTLKTRVFYSWEDAMLFCAEHNVHRIESNFLNFITGVEEHSGKYASLYVSSFDKCVHVEFKPCWFATQSSYIVSLEVDNGNISATDLFYKLFDYQQLNFTYIRVDEVSLMPGASLTVYYFE